MASELAFVLINPYTIAKSRTGGVIARYIARANLKFVAARMFGPSMDLVHKYAMLVREAGGGKPEVNELIAKYIEKSYAPNPATGRPRRVMMLLFEGEDAVDKVWQATGSATLKSGSGETIRDTYGDYVLDEESRVIYFEPAVLVAPSRRRAAATLKLWGRYAARDGGMIVTATDVPDDDRVEKTLVMLKPDNFRFPSARPGNIIDLLSSSGLRIVAVQKFSMTVAQAEEFYGPLRQTLEAKFKDIGAGRAARALQQEFGFEVPDACIDALCRELGPLFANAQFESVVKFMTGHAPSECRPNEKAVLASENCVALVYEGIDAVKKIRSLIGPTDPSKAAPGSVRREFGSDIMVNAAHASDSPENAEREMRIIRVEENMISPIVERYYGNVLSRLTGLRGSLPAAGRRWIGKVRRLWQPHPESTQT